MSNATAELYQTDAKLLWRRRVWGAIESITALYGQGVAIMPGPTDAEVEVVRSIGVPERKIHLVDHNPAVVASHRKRRPGIGGTYGVPVARAFERMAADGRRLSAAHLDFCSCLSDTLLAEIQHVAATGVVDRAIAVTVLRGRESGGVLEVFRSADEWEEKVQFEDDVADVWWDGGPSGLTPTRWDMYRAAEVKRALNQGAAVESWDPSSWGIKKYGAYRSGAGHQTMMWVVLARGLVSNYAHPPYSWEYARQTWKTEVGIGAYSKTPEQYLKALDRRIRISANRDRALRETRKRRGFAVRLRQVRESRVKT